MKKIHCVMISLLAYLFGASRVFAHAGPHSHQNPVHLIGHFLIEHWFFLLPAAVLIIYALMRYRQGRSM